MIQSCFWCFWTHEHLGEGGGGGVSDKVTVKSLTLKESFDPPQKNLSPIPAPSLFSPRASALHDC